MRRLIRVVVLIVLGLVLLPYVLTPIYSAGHPISTLMIGRFLTGEPVTRTWVDIDAVAPALPRSIVAAEDAKFCFHRGIDWDSVQDIIEDAQDGGEVTRGGSTITQQLAKNMFLSSSRSYIRKGQELVLAYMIEHVMSKERILELYLNVAEWGVGVFGAQAAAQHYFNTSAANLSASQSARLAAMLPNPRFYDTRRNSNYLNSRVGVLTRRMQMVDIP